MSFNFVDIIVIAVIIFGALVGFKRGAIKSAVSLVGFALTVYLAFILKDTLAVVLYKHLPFFNFPGLLSGLSVLNIALYEIIAFIVLLIIFTVLYKILLMVSSVLEKIVRATIILNLPSKLIGMVIGVVEYYLLAFIILYIISLPFFNIEQVSNSKFRDPILNNTPIINKYAKNLVKVGEEFWDVADKYKTGTDVDGFNREVLTLMLKYNITTTENVEYLVENKKISIKNIDKILNDYKSTK